MQSTQQLQVHSNNQVRNRTIRRIKTSLSQIPIISRNQTLIQHKLCSAPDTHETTSCEDLLASTQDVSATFEHADIFNQKYEILEKIGEGSNGVVHRCVKKKNRQQFAVKSFMFDDEQLVQIKNNFIAIKNLCHPSIVKYQALYIDLKKHACWLVMELLPTPSLSHLVPKDQTEVKFVMKQLMETLRYLHQKAITHRDIKLQNLLYDCLTLKLKLIDFGICRKHHRRGIKFDMLTITGTLYYRAPEMFTGGGYNEKVDVWAAGVLLYKLVAGVTPFESEYHSNTIANILSAQVSFTSEFDKYSSALKGLIMRMLRKNPAQRVSAVECLRDIWFYSMPNTSPYHKGSYDEREDELLSSPLTPILLSMSSYVRNINGDEFHCIDSDEQDCHGMGGWRLNKQFS